MALYLGSSKVSALAGITSGGTGGGSIEGVCYVTFMSEDCTTELYKKAVLYGDDCMNPVSKGWLKAPTKEPTNTFEYTYNGWSPTPGGSANSSALSKVTEDRTVYAAFTPNTRYYTIRFFDGERLLKTSHAMYGSIPSYTPEKDGYYFIGWTPEVVAVTGDADYYAVWEEIVILLSGSCGDDVYYELYRTGELVITGTGPMDDDYSSNTQPWKEYKDSITSVSIGDGVTNIGDYAFYGCTELNSFNIGNDVASIGYCAFSECTNLTTLTNLNNVNEISSHAFYKCTNIYHVTIPDSVTYIGSHAFGLCDKLEAVRFNDTTTWKVSTNTIELITISNSNLTSSSKAATYLTDTYVDRSWTKV